MTALSSVASLSFTGSKTSGGSVQALRIYFGGGVVLAALVVPVAAQTVLPTIDVVAASPTAGSETSRDRLPGSSSSVDAAAIARSPQPDAVRALEQRVPSVTVNDNTGNTFQPEVEFRGFVASPVPGTQQGIAVYQNGVRINEPFGDAVNWDFIPSNAIDQASIVSNNPVFGLNALGGALTLRMKDGFTWQGLETDLRIGSFGRRQAALQYGKTIGAWSTYVAMEAIHDGGWRQRAHRKFAGPLPTSAIVATAPKSTSTSTPPRTASARPQRHRQTCSRAIGAVSIPCRRRREMNSPPPICAASGT